MRILALLCLSNVGALVCSFSTFPVISVKSVGSLLQMPALRKEGLAEGISRRDVVNAVVGSSFLTAALSAGVDPAVAADISKQMKALEKQFEDSANSNGAPEKHIPKVTLGSILDQPTLTKVEVLVPHVMDAEKPHFIQAIWLHETKTGDVAVAKVLPASEPSPPKLVCGVPKGAQVTPYLYCNLHGLWKGEPFTA